MSTTETEIERTYDVDESARIPELSSLGEVQTAAPVTLWSVYYDTADGALAEHRMTLRRRTGNREESWHLTSAAKGDTQNGRTEHTRAEYLAEPTDGLPPELASRIRSVIRDRGLAQVVRMITRRSVIRLVDEHAAVVAEVVDDVVLAIELPSGTQRAWRQWAVELVDSTPDDQDASKDLLHSIEKVLRTAGATRSKNASKLARATGRTALGRETATVEKSATSLEVVLAILTELVAALVAADPRARDDEPDALHAMRVVVRRLRSVLAAFRTVLDREVTDGIRDRLKQLGSVLGEARDAEVRRRRAIDLLAEVEPDDARLDHGAPDVDLRRRLVDDALNEYQARHEDVIERLNGTDYFRLLDDLDQLIARPPIIMPGAMADARTELRAALRREARRARKRLARANEDDLASIHEARKAARRLRYVAEALSAGAAPVLGKKARILAEAGHELQSAGGEHRDSALYIDHLDKTARAAAAAGENTAGYGTFADAERRNARAAFDRFTVAAEELR